MYHLGWVLFLGFEKTVLLLPWPVKNYLVKEFFDEYRAQRHIIRDK
jgi:hypothetical protein